MQDDRICDVGITQDNNEAIAKILGVSYHHNFDRCSMENHIT